MRKRSRPFQGALHPIPKIDTRSKPYVREQEMAMTISLFSMTYVRCLERESWKLILPNRKQTANGNLLYASGNSKRGSVSTQRGGMGREMGEV